MNERHPVHLVIDWFLSWGDRRWDPISPNVCSEMEPLKQCSLSEYKAEPTEWGGVFC